MSDNLDSIIAENWISSNKDKNFGKNCSQKFKLFDFEIPIYNEFPGLELEKVASTEEKSLKTLEGRSDIFDRKEIKFKTINSKRGRKNMGTIYIGQKKSHDKASKDNILRKFNVNFLNFVIGLANEIVIYYGFDGNFIEFSYAFKKNITKKSLKKLKNLTFGELLCNAVSKKWKKHSSNENEIFYNQVIEMENIKKIFSEKYMTIMDIFLKSQRNIKIGDSDFYLSPKIEMFDNFLLNIENKYENDGLYIEKIKEVIKDY